MHVDCIAFFGGTQSVELPDDGRITPEVEHVFSNGQCHALALAIHEATGWQMVALDFWQDIPNHVLVRMPDGRLLDIAGTDVEDRWPTADCRDCAPEDVDAWVEGIPGIGGYIPPNLDAARTFVPTLLSYVGAQVAA